MPATYATVCIDFRGTEVVELSLSAAGKVVGRSVDSEDDRRLVAEVVSGVKGDA